MCTVQLDMVNVFMIMPISFLGILSSSLNMVRLSHVMFTGSQDMVTGSQAIFTVSQDMLTGVQDMIMPHCETLTMSREI
jgi:hypothetical protein